jgi:hypothetical protein
MDNLTLSLKVAKPHTIDPLEGHTVVIFEKVGDAGEEYRFEIEPGQTRPRTKLNLFEWLRGQKPPNYFAYAVSGLPELRWTFTTDVTLDIQAHKFTLLVTLAYSVGGPRLLVTRRNDDPIRQVRDYIAGLLARQFAQRTWGEIRHDFRLMERQIIAATIDAARQFADHFGIRVHGIELNHRLQEKDFADLQQQEAAQRAKEQAELDGEVERAKLAQTAQTDTMKSGFDRERALRDKEHEQELSLLDRDHEIDRRSREALLARYRRDDMLDEAVAQTIVRLTGSAETPDDLLRTFGKLRANDQLSIGSGSAPQRAILTGGSQQSGAGPTVAEALSETEQMGFAHKDKQQLQSAILHLIAELLLDGSADEQAIARYAAKIDELRHDLKLSREHSEYLKQFVHFEPLRESLR